MSVVVKREHPSGDLALTIDAISGRIVVGMGELRDKMHYFGLSVGEAQLALEALVDSIEAVAAAGEQED